MSDHQLSESELALLGDLTRLLRKHGPETFKSLAASLADPEWPARLAAILSTVADAAPQQRANKRPTTARSTSEKVAAQLQHIDQKRLTLLRPVADNLVNGETLPRLKDVAEFASAAGFPAVRAKSRGDAVVALVRNMIAMPIDELERLVQGMSVSTSQDQRSLEGWNRIIERSRAETTGHEPEPGPGHTSDRRP